MIAANASRIRGSSLLLFSILCPSCLFFQFTQSILHPRFESYMARKIVQREAVAATDQAANWLGVIAFSRAGNRITFFAVSKSADFHETAQELLSFALRQLDTGKTISINVPKSEHEIALAEKSFFERNGFIIYDGNALENGCPVLSLARPSSD
jgi:hypothetical protein